MHVLKNIPLASYTSLGCGGPAEQLLVVKDTAELEAALHQYRDTQISMGLILTHLFLTKASKVP